MYTCDPVFTIERGPISVQYDLDTQTAAAAMPPSAPPSRPILIRSVWYDNLDAEFNLITSVIDKYSIISMDSEFPGVVFRPSDDSHPRTRPPATNYSYLKANVDLLNLIQIGMTLSDENGNLPDLGTDSLYIWEFNFRDFDVARDPHAPDSVELLKRQGINFQTSREIGIESFRFAELMMSSGLVCNDSVSWVTFHGAYDFGYLLKILTQRLLPDELGDFLGLVAVFFGAMVYDVKHLMKFCVTLHGGLDRVSQALNLKRVAGKTHQAGSDSLLTLHAFRKIRAEFFSVNGVEKYANVLNGLEFYPSDTVW